MSLKKTICKKDAIIWEDFSIKKGDVIEYEIIDNTNIKITHKGPKYSHYLIHNFLFDIYFMNDRDYKIHMIKKSIDSNEKF